MTTAHTHEVLIAPSVGRARWHPCTVIAERPSEDVDAKQRAVAVTSLGCLVFVVAIKVAALAATVSIVIVVLRWWGVL